MKCPECGVGGLKGHKGVAMHIGRVHTKTIIDYERRRRPRGPRKSLIAVDSEHETSGNGVAVAEPLGSRVRRQVSLVDKPVIVPSKPHLQQFQVNGCPNCLFPLKVMNDALKAQGIPLPPYCPVCTMPVELIRTSMRIVEKQSQPQPA